MEDWKYLVEHTINMSRTDGQVLTDEENAILHEAKAAAEAAIVAVMNKHGQKKHAKLGSKTVKY